MDSTGTVDHMEPAVHNLNRLVVAIMVVFCTFLVRLVGALVLICASDRCERRRVRDTGKFHVDIICDFDAISTI